MVSSGAGGGRRAGGRPSRRHLSVSLSAPQPFTERGYYPPAAGGAGPPPFAAFQFRGRLEGPDWRRLSAVDVGRVCREGDVAALQEHLEHVTFCSAERERCPHCQAPADPLLLRLLRLSQLCTEYLLHSQEYLSAQLGGLEEALREAGAQRDRLGEEVARRAQEVKGLKEECRRRKKMISTQQMMLEARASYHQVRGVGTATCVLPAPSPVEQPRAVSPGRGLTFDTSSVRYTCTQPPTKPVMKACVAGFHCLRTFT